MDHGGFWNVRNCGVFLVSSHELTSDPPPDFSILHATIRLPDGWRAARDEWRKKCSDWGKVEYILAVDPCDADLWPPWEPDVRQVTNPGRRCSVDAFNWAAKCARGKVLIQSADDWFPPENWDLGIRGALGGDLSREAVVDVDSQHFTGQIIICPIMTRSYYEKPGRGTCRGEFFYPEYMSMGADDDLTEYAKRDNVVVQAYHLRFEHRHPWTGQHQHDTHGAYAHNQSLAAWETKDRVLKRRKEDGFLK